MRILLFLVALLSLSAFSQEKAIFIGINNKSLAEAIEFIENDFEVVFSYNDKLIENIYLSIPKQKWMLSSLLTELEFNTGLHFELYQNRYVVITKGSKQAEVFGVQNLDIVVLNSYLSKGIKKMNAGNYTLNPKEINILPGLTEFDALESIQMLPGNFSPNETATNFFVRGGYSDQNRLVWDGINLYHKGHLFGMISPLNPHIISDISFFNKGTHARYGERLSSVVDITTSKTVASDFRVEGGMNGVNTDVVLEAPIIKEKLSAQVSFRRSYMDVFQTQTFNQLSKKVFNNSRFTLGNVDDTFLFFDTHLKINYRPNAKDYFYASFIAIDNELKNNNVSTTTNENTVQDMAINNLGYTLGWERRWNKSLQQKTSVFFSDYDFNYLSTTTNLTNNDNTVFEKRNVIFDSGITTELVYQPSKNKTFSLGYQYNLKDVGFAFLSNADLAIILDQEKRILQTHSLYGGFDAIVKNWDFSLGIRNTYFVELNQYKIEPRFIITKPISRKIKLQVTGEIKHQALSEIDETVLSDISLENRVWRLANNDNFPLMNSHQISLGALYVKNGYHLDIDTYYRRFNNISALSLGFLNPNNPGFNIGKQRTLGLDAFAKKRFKEFNTWFSYTLNTSKNTFQNLNENNSFRSRTSITHLISTSVSYYKNDFTVALGWRWHTGRPYTISSVNDDGELEFTSGINTGELPVYHRLDLSSTYSFFINPTKTLKAKVGLSVRNLYNRINLISREYEGNNSVNEPVSLVDRFSIGITPNLMFRVYW